MINDLYRHFLASTGVSTDTRTIQKGNIWFALKGPNFNANSFAKDALSKGAGLVVVDDPSIVKGDDYFLVDDGLKALQDLANHHRRQFTIPFLGITGSNGKTTTKELVRDVLAKKYNVHATKGNLNNHIGVPLTLLSISEETELAIIEMGANKQGDIAELCAIAEPTHGLITNIGKAHLEGFGGIEGVFKGKTEMYDFISKDQGTLFINSENRQLVEKAQKSTNHLVTFSHEEDDFSAKLVQEVPQMEIGAHGTVFQAKIEGAYNFQNICAALCIGESFGVASEDAIDAVANYVPDNNRSQVLKKGSNTIILDAYNANPTSMAAALENFTSHDYARKVVILGDMLELGEETQEQHKEIGELTKRLNLDEVHFCGPHMQSALEGNEQANYWANKEVLSNALKEQPIEHAHVLIKGSRGMSLETLVEDLG